jgi:hypothetical protein
MDAPEKQHPGEAARPPDPPGITWKWIVSNIGIKTATAMFIAGTVLASHLENIPAVFESLGGAYTGYRAEHPRLPTFAKDELHIGVAVFTADGISQSDIERLRSPLGAGNLVELSVMR